MKYRIIVETQANGMQNFYVQKKVFWFLWFYFKSCININTNKYKVLFSNIEDAKIAIEDDKRRIDWEKGQKIICRQILNK